MKKGKIINLITFAARGEAVFTGTFQSGDSRYKYDQAYYDLAPHWVMFFLFDRGGALGLRLLTFVVGIGSLWFSLGII